MPSSMRVTEVGRGAAQPPVRASTAKQTRCESWSAFSASNELQDQQPRALCAWHAAYAPTADTPSVNVRLARGQLHRLVRCVMGTASRVCR
jgi:hypothetical protein